MPNSKINSFWSIKLAQQKKIFPENYHFNLQKEAEFFSEIGIQSEQDYEKFLVLRNFLPKISQELANKKLNSFELAKISQEVFFAIKNSDSISLFQLYSFTKSALQKNRLPIKKIAYPNSQGEFRYQPNYNLDKWLETMKKVYAGMQKGLGYNNSLELCTEGWDPVEKNDFQAWVNFYSQGEHLKYKTAQYYQGDGIQIPVDHLRAKLPEAPQIGMNSEKSQEEVIQKKIQSIIGRLTSAEKLSMIPEVQRKLAQLGINIGEWFEALHALKRKIQVAPLRAIAALEKIEIRDISKVATDKMLEDLLYREFYRASQDHRSANYLVRFAQAVPAPSTSGPLPTNPGAPSNPVPPNNLPLDGPTTEVDDGAKAVEEFIAGLNGLKLDSNSADDEIEMGEPIKTAQVVPPNMPVPQKVQTNPFANKNYQPPNLPEKDLGLIRPEEVFESVLKNVKVSDVIERLEALADVFRNREISRQMAIIDLFMDALGIATFFPTLAEASTKTLESNQYALTRIEDIISKLRGSVDIPAKHKIVLDRDQDIDRPAPEVDPNAVKNKLQQEEIKESIENENEARERLNSPPEQAGQASQQPVTNVQQDLAAPVPVQPPIKPPIRR